MKYCMNCGAPLKEDDKFCPGCGAQVPKEQETVKQPNVQYCMNCGAPLKSDERFCSVCGSPVNGGNAPVGNAQPSQTSQPTNSQPNVQQPPVQQKVRPTRQQQGNTQQRPVKQTRPQTQPQTPPSQPKQPVKQTKPKQQFSQAQPEQPKPQVPPMQPRMEEVKNDLYGYEKKSNGVTTAVVIIILLILAGGAGFYFYNKNHTGKAYETVSANSANTDTFSNDSDSIADTPQGDISQNSENSFKAEGTHKFTGSVDSYPIVMNISIRGDGNVSGYYYYVKYGSKAKLYLNGSLNDNNLILYESNSDGEQTGQFDGYIDDKGLYNGTFYVPSDDGYGKSLNFNLKAE